MNRSLLISPALLTLALTFTACSSEAQDPPPKAPAEQKTETATQQQPTTPEVQEATAAADAQVKGTEPASTSTTAPAAPSTTAAPAEATVPAVDPNEPLKSQFVAKKQKNFRTVELDFAKQKAMNRTTSILVNETNSLYDTATKHLNGIVGSLSEPQVQENYYFDDENVESGVFVVALVRESYMKSEKGDVCQVSTRVRVATSIDAELAPPTAATAAPAAETPSAEQSATTAPESMTEIKCYSDNKPTYYQQIVR